MTSVLEEVASYFWLEPGSGGHSGGHGGARRGKTVGLMFRLSALQLSFHSTNAGMFCGPSTDSILNLGVLC